MTLAFLAVTLATAAAPGQAREILEDGLEIVVVPLATAPTASLRLVVRAGGSMDPRGKAGLAHAVEHCIFQGSYDVGGAAFRREARRAGAVVNAHTHAHSTRFELDAPADEFPRLAERFVRMVTSPAWERVDLRTEMGVIRTEGRMRNGEGLLSFVEDALFPTSERPTTLLGSSDTREAIRREDLAAFYDRYYLPGNMTAVFTGKVTLAEAKALLSRSVRLPPALPAERPSPIAETPSLPLEQDIPAGLHVTVLGHHLARWDRASCSGLAALLELRAIRELRVQGPRVSGVQAWCARLRGQPFLLALAYARRLDAGDLPEAMSHLLQDAATRPASAQERALVVAHLEHRRLGTLADAVATAEAIAAEAAEPRRGEATDLEALAPTPAPDPAGWMALARESFVADRRVLLQLSPLRN